MKKAILMIICLAVVIGGCAWQQSRVEADYGTSYQLQKYGQTLNPDAEKTLTSTQGLDGQAALNAMTRYRKTFEKQEKTPSYIFNFGK